MERGIKELKDVVGFVIKLAHGIDKSMDDGKIGVMDIVHLVPVMLSAGDAFEGIKEVPKEIKDLSKEEREELCEFVKEEFDIDNDNIEAMVEKGLTVMLSIYGMVQDLKKK